MNYPRLPLILLGIVLPLCAEVDDPTQVSIAWGNGVFVGVGDNAVSTSLDGVNWVTRLEYPLADGASVTGAEFVHDRFIAHGTEGLLMSSYDGIEWQRHFVPVGQLTADRMRSVWDVKYGNGIFLAVGQLEFFTSTDGLLWQWGADVDVNFDMFRLEFGGGKFVVPGPLGILGVSENGRDWRRVDGPPDRYVRRLAYGPAGWVAFADQSNGQGLEVWTSPDAETWTKSEIPLPEVAAPFRSPTYYSIHVIEGRYFIPTNNGMLVSEDGVSYTVAADTGANEQFTDIAYGGGVFMVGGFRGNINDEGPIFLNSRDGDTWTTDPLSVLAVEGQPADATVVPGGAVSMSVAATQPATAYQWYHDGNPVAGAVDSTLLLLDADQADAGSYQVDIVGVHGVTRSAPGMVEVANLELASGQYPGRLVNLSVLAHAGSGDNTLIAGFAVAGGQSGEDLNLLLRGLGPTLVPFDVAGALVNPHLELFGNSQTLGENDDWGGNSALIETSARLGATPFVDGDSADAALQTTAVGGAYTVHLVGVDEEGRGLAEVYDASLEEERGGETPRLTNLSTRVSMAEDGSPLIVGFVLRGASTQTVLLRAVGPGLTQFDVEGVLANPRLKLFRGEQQVLVTSTGAETITAQAAAAHVGAFALPDDSADAVAIVTLEAGVYTVHVESADSVPSPGSVVLVELYTID